MYRAEDFDMIMHMDKTMMEARAAEAASGVTGVGGAFGDLRGLLLRTAGLKDILAECLADFRSRIDVAFVYGSVARGDEPRRAMST